MILYVDPFTGGHHPEFVPFFYSVFERLGQEFKILTPSANWSIAKASEPSLQDKYFHPIDNLEGVDGRSIHGLLKDIEALGSGFEVDLVYFSILDPFVGPLWAMSLARPFSLPWAGTFIRDGFNSVGEPLSVSVRLRAALKLTLLRRAARSSRGLFTFNPFWMRTMPCEVRLLPESQSLVSKALARENKAWPRPKPVDRRKTFLSFGGISERKGVKDVLQAMSALTDRELARIRFKIIGPSIDKTYRSDVETLAVALRAKGAIIEIDDTYIPSIDLIGEILACDVVVAAYLDHAGSSSVLGLALQVGRPVIGSARHQMGAEIKGYDLGQAISGKGARRQDALVGALRHYLTHDFVPTEKTRAWLAFRNYDNAFAVACETFANWVHLPKEEDSSSFRLAD